MRAPTSRPRRPGPAPCAGSRLREATGQPWRLSARYGVSFSPALATTITDAEAALNVEGGTLRVRADVIRLAGSPLALWRGASPNRVEVERLAVRVPSAWWRHLGPGTGATASSRGAMPGELVLREGAVVLVGPDGRDEATIGGVGLTAARTPTGRRIEASLRFGTLPVSAGIDVAAAPGPGGVWPVRLTASSPALPGGSLTATADATVEGSGVELSRLAGQIGSNGFTGASRIDLAGKPRVRLDLFVPIYTATADPGPVAAAGPRDAAADFAALRFVDGRLALRIGELRASAGTVTEIGGTGSLTDGAIALDVASAGAFGGQATASARLAPEGPLLAGTLRSDLRAMRLRPLMTAGAGSSAVDGCLSVSWDLAGRGSDRESFLRSGAGTARVAVVDVRMNLSTLPGFMRTLVAQAVGLKAEEAGTSPVFDSVSAGFAVANGRATTNDVQATGPLLAATGSGSLDLPSGTIDFRFDPRIVGGNRLLKGLDIRLPILLGGSLLAPQVTPDLAGATASGGLPADLGALGGLAADLLGGSLGSSLFGTETGTPRRDPPPPPRRR